MLAFKQLFTFFKACCSIVEHNHRCFFAKNCQCKCTIMGDNLKVVLCQVFNSKLGRIAILHSKGFFIYKQPLLELKTWPWFCPDNYSFSMTRTREPYLKGRIRTYDLLVLQTSLDRLLFKLKMLWLFLLDKLTWAGGLRYWAFPFS
jgi:hypothetical protein